MRPEKSEVNRLWADNTKIKTLTSWKPQFGGIEGFKNGLQQCIDWYRKPENIAFFKTDIYNI